LAAFLRSLGEANDTELLRVLASVLDQDQREPGWFLALCEQGVIADILQAIELREGG
jgi:hypothetical protein